MTADDKYSVRNSENLWEPIQIQVYKTLKTFSQHFAQIVQSTSKFEHFEKKMFLLAYLFSKLPTVKGTVTQMFKYHRVIAPSYGQRVKRSKTLVKCPWEYFYQNCLLLWSKLTWETSLLLIFELLRVFIETLTADHRYSLCYIWNLQVLHQMQLSKKLKNFLNFSFHFWNVHQILNILKKKMTFIANVFPKL